MRGRTERAAGSKRDLIVRTHTVQYVASCSDSASRALLRSLARSLASRPSPSFISCSRQTKGWRVRPPVEGSIRQTEVADAAMVFGRPARARTLFSELEAGRTGGKHPTHDSSLQLASGLKRLPMKVSGGRPGKSFRFPVAFPVRIPLCNWPALSPAAVI